MRELLELLTDIDSKGIHGRLTYISFFADGSGGFYNDDDEEIFDFENIENLKEQLKEILVVEEMTLKQVCKELGRDVKIIK